MPSKPTRAALYARVSTTGHGQDVGLQFEELRRVAETRGWEVVQEFVDEGIVTDHIAPDRSGLSVPHCQRDFA